MSEFKMYDVTTTQDDLAQYISEMIGKGCVEGVTTDEKAMDVADALVNAHIAAGHAKLTGNSYCIEVYRGPVRTELEQTIAKLTGVSTDYAGLAFYCLMNINKR